MVIVECPLCDALARFDAHTGVLACHDCGVAFELAPDDAPAVPKAA